MFESFSNFIISYTDSYIWIEMLMFIVFSEYMKKSNLAKIIALIFIIFAFTCKYNEMMIVKLEKQQQNKELQNKNQLINSSNIKNVNMNNLEIVELYYNLIIKKNINDILQYLDKDAVLSSPMAEVIGKNNVIKAIEGFAIAVDEIKINAKFVNNDQVMLQYDVTMDNKKLKSAVLFNFKNNLITHIQLFYDTYELRNKKEEIFKK